MDGETNCWQCHALLKSQPSPTPPEESRAAPPQRTFSLPKYVRLFRSSKPSSEAPAESEPAPLISYDPEHIASLPQPPPAAEPEPAEVETAAPVKQVRVTLTGEVVEEEVQPPVARVLQSADASQNAAAAVIGTDHIEEGERVEVMVLTFCKHCGHQNDEGVKECARCGKELDVIARSEYREMEAAPRAWGFDVLGAIWVVLGLAAIYAGQFLVQTNAARPPSIADYLWTGVVAVAPGVLVIVRHHFCRMLFWVMTLGSIMVWTVLFVVWFTGHLHVSDKGQVGLTWILALSLLSAISFFLVRTNDAFDYDIGPWLGRQ
jgi:hypothetical protein